MLNTMALGGFEQYLCNEVRSLMNEISVLYKRDLPELPSTFHHVRIQEVYDLKEGSHSTALALRFLTSSIQNNKK